uniref:Uncharacterized protein n=1 Tax=Arundo donax TaxID=35708 RepID=A0A0A8YYQ1_ARUDO
MFSIFTYVEPFAFLGRVIGK